VTGWSADEMMTVAAARALAGRTTCFVGIGLPSTAANLARRLHSPGLSLIYESGTIGAKPTTPPLSIGDGELATTADAVVSSAEIFNYWLQPGRIEVGFLSAAQLDKYGNINTTVIGDDYIKPAVRLPGAGGAPTASAVLGDLVAVCRNRLSGATGPGESAYAALPVSPMGDVVTRYHISLDVADKPGVLAQVATVFAEHGVSIDTVRQQGRHDSDGEASLVVVTHRASDASLTGTVEALRKLDTVRGVASIMRVEGE